MNASTTASALCASCNTKGVKRVLEPVPRATQMFAYRKIHQPSNLKLGSLGGIRNQVQCPFCKLVARISPSNQPDEDDIEGEIIVTGQGFGTRPRYMRLYNQDHLYLGSIRLTSSNVNSHQTGLPKALNFDAIERAIENCQSTHTSAHLESFSRYSSALDITLIDTQDGCLVRASTRYEFITLSYVWGDAPAFFSTTANRAILEVKGSLNEKDLELPSVVRDAMDLTRKLRERYIWIDSLCIEQDNVAQKHSQISQMDIIYSQSKVTIIAYHGKNSAWEIPGLREWTLRPNAIIINLETGLAGDEEDLDGAYGDGDGSDWETEEEGDPYLHSGDSSDRESNEGESDLESHGNKEKKYDVDELDWDSDEEEEEEEGEGFNEDHSCWGKGAYLLGVPSFGGKPEYQRRAWTYQERLLSKRCLIMTDFGAYFHCPHHWETNFINNTTKVHAHTTDGWGTEIEIFPELDNLPSILLSKRSGNQTTGYTWSRAFANYARLAEEFSRRELSFPSDALNAFSGFIGLFKHHFGGEILCGLPERVLDAALLWTLRDADELEPERNEHFPSWSWAGWMAEIDYHSGPAFGAYVSHDYYTWGAKFPPIRSELRDLTHTRQFPKRPISRDSSIIDMSHVNSPRTNLGIETTSAFDVLHFTTEIVKFESFCFKDDGEHSKNLWDMQGWIPFYTSSEKYRCGMLYDNYHVCTSYEYNEYSLDEYILLSRSFYPGDVPGDQQPAEFRGGDDRAHLLFDHTVFKPSRWCILNVMLVRWNSTRTRAERIAIGQVHEKAWKEGKPQDKSIQLV